MLSLATALTVILGFVFGAIAVALGVMAARRTGRGVARGRRRAWLAAALGAAGIALTLVLLATGANLLNDRARENLKSCERKANGDQDQINNGLQKYKGQFDH